MPSGEMLKKLLDEFVEKEALVTEELNVIAEQIQELEMRLDKCRARLGTIGTDRQRVLQIKERYAGGVFYERSQPLPQSQPVQQPQPQLQQSPPPQPVAPQVHYEPPQPEPEPSPQIQQEPEPAPHVPEPMPHIPEPAPQEPPRSTLTGINVLMGARKAQSSPVSFEMEQEQQPPQPEPQPEPEPEPEPVWGQVQQQAQQPAASTNDKVVDIEQTQNEDDSDTVKSINDALRSLFR